MYLQHSWLYDFHREQYWMLPNEPDTDGHVLYGQDPVSLPMFQQLLWFMEDFNHHFLLIRGLSNLLLTWLIEILFQWEKLQAFFLPGAV